MQTKTQPIDASVTMPRLLAALTLAFGVLALGRPSFAAAQGSASQKVSIAVTPPPPQKKPFVKPSDAELKQKLTPLQYEVTQHAGTESAVPQRVLEQPRGGDLRRRRVRRAALQLARQVRVRHRMAELHQAARAGEHQDATTISRRHGSHRSAVGRGQLAPRPRVRRRPAPDRAALLHEFGGDALHPGRQLRGRGVRRVPSALWKAETEIDAAPAQPAASCVCGAMAAIASCITLRSNGLERYSHLHAPMSCCARSVMSPVMNNV